MKKNQKIKIVITSVILIIFAQQGIYSQWKPKTITITFLSESVSLPFGQIVTSPVHPGISVGADLWVKEQTPWYRSLGVEAGYYYHELYEHAIMLDAVYCFGYTFGFKLRINLIGSMGYKHSILSGETYFFENGEYKARQHPGKPQFNTKIGTGLAYPVTNRISLTADYLGMIAIPYSPDQGMPFATHAFLRAGVKIKLQ